MLTIFPYEINLYDLALCIYNNDTPIGCKWCYSDHKYTICSPKVVWLSYYNHRHLEAKGWRTVLFTSLPAPIYFIFLFARRVTLGSAATTAGSLCLELSSQPSDYSYFKSDFMSTWAGPQHWRLRSKFSKGTYALNGRHATPVCGILRFGGEVTVFESVFICVLRWCYTGRFATTIFSATQRCNAVAML